MSDRPVVSAGPPATVADTAGRIAAAQAEELRRHRKAVRRGDDPGAVHDMRVAVRRLRTALRMVRAHVDVPKAVRAGLKRLAKRLGAVRDADVMLELLRDARLPGADGEARRLARLVRRLERRRAQRQRTLRRAVAKPRLKKLARRLDGFAAAPPPLREDDVPAAAVLAELSERLAVTVASNAAMREAAPPADALHRLRIDVKRLRYALDLHAACGVAYDVERKMAHGLQDVLGAIHDRDLLLEWLGSGRKPFRGDWPALEARLGAERARLMRRFRRLRDDWLARTRPEPEEADPTRFVNLEVQRVGLRLMSAS